MVGCLTQFVGLAADQRLGRYWPARAGLAEMRLIQTCLGIVTLVPCHEQSPPTDATYIATIMTQPLSGAPTNPDAAPGSDAVTGAVPEIRPSTPALLLDEAIMQGNLQRMREHLARHRVVARPHVKTAKSLPIIDQMTVGSGSSDGAQAAGAAADCPRLTVSTLREAGEVIAAGYRDVLYAVGIVPSKLARLAELAAASGARISVLLDSVAMAHAVVANAPGIDAFIELDVDDHRAGVAPESDELLAIGAILATAPNRQPDQQHADNTRLRGVLTHAGGAYDCRSQAELVAMAQRERAGAVRAAERLRASGVACPEVSIGSTPTVTFAESFAGITEVRVGVYVFNDLVMAGLGVCGLDEIALSVLSTVIGHQPGRNTLLIDAGWMALSSDRGTAGHSTDQGLGLVLGTTTGCAGGDRAAELVVVGANQEHGLVQRRDAGPLDFEAFPIGCELRVLPIHACATAAQFDGYHLLGPPVRSAPAGAVSGSDPAGPVISGYWPRFSGWHL